MAISITALAQDSWKSASLPIVDASNGKKIDYVIVSQQKRNIFSAVDNGKLAISYNNAMMTDSLYCNATGYLGLKTTLGNILQKKEIALTPVQAQDKVGLEKTINNDRLSRYNNNLVSHWIGFPINDKPFGYLQVGQIFPNTHEQAKLKSIRLNQLYFNPLLNYTGTEITDAPRMSSMSTNVPAPTNLAQTNGNVNSATQNQDGAPNDESNQTKSTARDMDAVLIYDDGSIDIMGYTYSPQGLAYLFETSPNKSFMHSYRPSYLQTCRYRLRIYQVDVNNQPIQELCTKPIVIEREPPVDNTNIDLTKYNILVPKGRFMVAVEWIPARKNINYVFWTKLFNSMGQSMRPFVGINEERGTQLNVMALDFAGNWKPFDYLSPYYTDLAMECEIGY